jgi:hypothetical protein
MEAPLGGRPCHRPGSLLLGTEGQAVVEGAVNEDNGNEALMAHVL